MKSLLKELREKRILISLNGEDIKLKFDGPKPSSSLISRIKENKAEIVKYLKQETRNQNLYEAIAATSNSDEGYPLSSAQFRLWILSQIEENSISYNMPFHVLLNGNYDISTFEKAIHSVIDRHEILRTVFRKNKKGEVRQWVFSSKEINIRLDYKDLSNHNESEKLALAAIEQDYHLPFNLAQGPLVRLKFIKIAKEKWLFYFNIHHIIGDGWSIRILERDTMECYNAYLENRTPALPSLNIQYKDYATWQLTHLETQLQEQHKKYWLDKFSGDLSVLDLPAYKQRPELKTTNGRRLSTYLNKKDIGKIRTYVSEREGTLFMFLLASLKVLLYHYTDQKDIIVGTPTAGRNHPDLEDQIGFYINTLALRSTITERTPFDAFYEQIKQDLLDAYAHQMYPFDQLIQDLNIERDTSRNALFDILVVLQNFADIKDEQEAQLDDANLVVDRGTTIAKFDATFTFIETEDNIRLDLTYNTDLYEYDLIARFMIHYRQLLSQLLTNNSSCIGDVDFLAESEREAKVYWTRQLSGKLPTLDLLIANERPKAKTLDYSTEAITWTKDIAGKFSQIGTQNNVVLHTTLLALTSVLLYRYSYQTDQIIGVVIAEKPHSGQQRSKEHSETPVPLRFTVNENDSIKEFFNQVNKIQAAGKKHQDFSFQKLAKELRLKRNFSRNPFFDVLVVVAPETLNNHKTTPYIPQLASDYNNSYCDLIFYFRPFKDGLHFSLVYNTSLFEKEVVSKIIEDFTSLTRYLANNAEISVGDSIANISTAEQHAYSDFSEKVSTKISEDF